MYEELRDAGFEAINVVRMKAGRSPLNAEKGLSEGADKHAEYMVFSGKFQHTEPKDWTEADDELIWRGQGVELTELVRIAVRSWLASWDHHQALLSPDYHRMGVGTYVVDDHFHLPCLYITARFRR